MAATQPTAHTFDSPTLRLACERHGPAHAPVALLLHGFPDDLRTWDAMAEQLVAASYQTLALSLRGCGGSVFPSCRYYAQRPDHRASPQLGRPRRLPVGCVMARAY